MKKLLITVIALFTVVIMTTSSVISANNEVTPREGDSNTIPLSEAVVLYVGSPNALVYGETKQIDEKNSAVVPFIENSRTLMPLSFVGKELGFDVKWDGETKQITMQKDDLTLEFTLLSNIMKKNGESVVMDTPAISRNGRALVPISYVATAMGLKVTYERGLIILDKNKTFSPTADKELINNTITALSGLPIVGTAKEFAEIVSKLATSNNLYNTKETLAGGVIMEDSARADSAAAPQATASAPVAENGASADHSSTITQVEGVDESDIIKTDGKYIYHLTNSALYIVEAYPANSMNKVSEISYSYENSRFSPGEMYVDGDTLVVIGHSWTPQNELYDKEAGIAVDAAYAYIPYSSQTKVIVYNIANRANPIVTREFSVDGSLLTSRKVGDMLYLIANQYINYYVGIEPIRLLPAYTDSTRGSKSTEIDCATMQYFPGSQDSNLLLICGIDVKNIGVEAQVTSVLGSGNNVYMSKDSLYISKYSYAYSIGLFRSINPLSSNETQSDVSTIFKFSLDNGLAIFNASGTVNGSILNQYSMDEYNGYFRVATTTSNWQQTQKNALYVLDSSMNVVGKIEDMAPGERVYSARFMGDRAFVVTFKTVDPLFAIDLSSPTNPVVLGELKIPGYSTYLHPYDENHLIGFGMDTEEITSTDSKGNITDVRTINNGLKVALFDISDMNNPVEVSNVVLGNRNTSSETLYNPKSLLFSKEKGILAFPVTSYPYTEYDGTKHEGFYGAYVLNVSKNGISLRGSLTQVEPDDYDNYGYADYKKMIQRIVFIGDTLYTASSSGIQSSDMYSLTTIDYAAY